MDEAADLSNYLPLSFKSPKEQEYIEFLWDAFATNYEHGKYQFAFLAYHMLTMSFVYFNVWQIRNGSRADFERAMVGFHKDVEKKLIEATSPFTICEVPESTVMRFLKLIGCDNAKVGSYAKLVRDRNDAAHSNGNIFFSTKAAIDIKIAEILRIVAEIQAHSEPVIQKCYRDFLLNNYDPEEREYPESSDQIHEVLIHGNYFSQRDVDACLRFNVESLAGEAGIEGMRMLHGTLRQEYGSEDDAARAA